MFAALVKIKGISKMAAEIKKFYDWLAEDYGRIWDWHSPAVAWRWKKFKEVMERREVRRMLDVACGVGRDVLELCRQGYEVVGVDFSPRSIAVAKKQAKKESLSANFVVGDMRSLVGLGLGGPFDMAICLGNTIAYLKPGEGLEDALSGMRSHLRPCGTLLLDTPNIDRYLLQEPSQPHIEVEVLKISESGQKREIFLLHSLYRWEAREIEKEVIKVLISKTTERAEAGRTVYPILTTKALVTAAQEVGFVDIECYEDMSGTPFNQAESEILYLLATNPG
jgi:SAM-dependent methyltransferase